MSKAFTRESDDAPENVPPPRPAVLLPPGAKNYVTPDGMARWREELDRLAQGERPALAAATDDDSRHRLRLLDQRILRLQQGLGTAVVVPPPALPQERRKVKFGANVTVREAGGELVDYRIVGAEETDLARNWVSWLSPIAKALLNAQAGERVRFRFPAGEEVLEIVSVRYEGGE